MLLPPQRLVRSKRDARRSAVATPSRSMSSGTPWQVRVPRSALKDVLRAPRPERDRLYRTLEAMETDPFAGDIVRLEGTVNSFRRRVGDWRIFFDAYPDQQFIAVTAIVRRTTTTYRNR